MWILIGTLAAATSLGTLYVLHRLAARSAPQAVATLQFWREASGSGAAATPALGRITERKTFVLLGVIVALLAAAVVARPWRDGHAATTRVVVFDGGGDMRWPLPGGPSRTPLDRAIDAVEGDLGGGDAPAVIVADETPKVLATAGEPVRAVRRRLESIRAGSVPESNTASGSALALNLAGQWIDHAVSEIDWYTDRAVVPDGVPPSIVSRVRLHQQTVPSGTAAVTGVRFEADAGGLRVTVARSNGALTVPLTVVAMAAGKPERSEPVAFAPDGRSVDVVFHDVPADGEVWTIQLRAAKPCQSVSVRVPDRPPLRFDVADGVPASLRAAAATTAGMDPRGRVIAVAAEGLALPAGAVGSLQVVRQGPAVPVGVPITGEPGEPLVAGLDFEGAATAAGPAVPTTSAVPLLRAGKAVVASYEASRNTVYVSSALVDGAAELPRRAAFPVLMGRLFHTLAGWTEMPPVVPAARLVNDPLWRPDGAIGVGEITAAAAAAPVPPTAGSRTVDPLPWALGLAFGLLCVEGFLLGARRIT